MHNTESSASNAGYKYQDIVALNRVVDLLIDNSLKKVIIDRDNTPHIEDVVLEYIDKVEYLQVKHSNSDKQETFTNSDLFSKEKSLFSKTFIGWKYEKSKFDNIEVILFANKIVSTQKTKEFFSTKEIVESINNTRDSKSTIDKLILKKMQFDLKENGVTSTLTDMKLFLKDLYFSFENPSKEELLNEIEEKLKIIIQTSNIKNYLNTLYKEVSLDATANNVLKRTFTKEKVERILNLDTKQKFTHFYDIPKNYINIEENFLHLYQSYKELPKGYIFFKGKAGSGKTSFITKFLSEIEKEEDVAVLRYYLFHFDDKSNEDSSERVFKNYFYYDLSIQLKNYLEGDFIGEIYLNKESNNCELFWNNIEILTNKFKKVIIVVDGIDHAIRAKKDISTFFDGLKLPSQIADNVICIFSGQPNWEGYPVWLKKEDNSEYFKSVEIEPFSIELCKQYIESVDYWSDSNLIDFLSYKAFKITKGYPLNLKIFIDTLKSFNSIKGIEQYLQSNNYFDNFEELEVYYDLLFEDVKLNYFKNNESDLLKLQALLYLLKEPISSEIIGTIFSEIDIYKYNEIINKIKPILVQNSDRKYELFHNDIRVYLYSKIDISMKTDMIRRIASYYMANIENNFSQMYLIKYLYDLKDYESIKNLLTFDRLDLKYRLLRDKEEIESELQIGLKVAKKLKDPIFMLQILLIEKQHEMVLENLLGTDFDNFNIYPKIENNLYSYISPSKDDLSWQAMRKREEFYQAFINLKIESQETRKYFFNKFSFDISEYVKDIGGNDLLSYEKKDFLERYFLIYLDIDKDSAVLKLKQLQEIEEKKNIDYVSQYFFNSYMNLYIINLEEIRKLQQLEIIIPKKTIINLVYNLYEANNLKELKELILRLIEMEFLRDDIVYLALLNGWGEFLPTQYKIGLLPKHELFQSQKEKEKLFKWGYLETYQEKLQSPFVLFDSLHKSKYSDYNENKIIIWLGYLSIKENFYESDVEQCFQFILVKDRFNFSKIFLFMDKFLSLIEEDKQKFVLNKLIKIYDKFFEYDEFIFYFYKWCQQYNFEKEQYTFKRLENELKVKIHGLDSSERINRITILIKIRKLLNQNYDDYLYLIRKYALSYGFRKDYQSEIFMEYFKNIILKDYPKYIDVIYKYLYVEQFKQNEYTEKTTTLEEVLIEILKVIYLNSKSDLFNILDYFFQDKKNDKKRLEIPSKLFLSILPNIINSQEEALLSYSFLKIGTTFSYYNYFTEEDEKKVENITAELNKFNISYVNTFKDNVVEKDDYKPKIYGKASEKEFIELLEEQKNTESYYFEKSGDITYNIKYYVDIFFEKNCEDNAKEIYLSDLLKSVCYMKDIELDDVNKLILQYLENLYSSVSEDIEIIDKKYTGFNIMRLLMFLKKNLFSVNERLVVSAIQSYIKIGEFYIDETIDFIIDSIDFNNPFHAKIWLDILVELPSNKYTNMKQLKDDLIELFYKSEYVYLDYSFKKIFLILDITVSKEYNYSFLELPHKIIIETDKESNSYQKFYSNTEYQSVEMFIRKLLKITDLSEEFLWNKINYFHYTKNISINYYQNCAKGLRLLKFHTPFFEAEFVEWLYQEKLLKPKQYDYILQILQTYDLKVLKQENYKPDYIKQLPFMDYKQKNIDEYLEKLEIDKILPDSSKIFSAHWEEFLNNDYIVTIDLNTVVINKELLSELKDNLEVVEQFYFNFGVDSFYINEKNIYYTTVDDFYKVALPIEISTYCYTSSIFNNSKLFHIVPNMFQPKLIKWDYGAINTSGSELIYQGCGQVHELKSEIQLYSDEMIIKFCRINIYHEKEDENGSRFFIL